MDIELVETTVALMEYVTVGTKEFAKAASTAVLMVALLVATRVYEKVFY